MTMAQSYSPQSVAAHALAPLTTLSNALDTIQQTLQTSTTYSALNTTTNTLLTADDSLTSALQLLHRQQHNHARILALQAEVLSLENKIKDTIRQARALRKDITDIHLSIDDDGDDDSDREAPEVDYQQLLNFAARIGKHNAVAKLEAEEQGERLKLEAVKARKKSEQLQQAVQATANTTENGIPPSLSQQHQQNPADILDKIDREAAELSARSDAFHTFSRLPFPAPDILRMGELGRLQLTRESDAGDPEGAVDREAEKLVRETEQIAPDEGMARRAREKELKEQEEEKRRAETAARRAEQKVAVPVGGSGQQPQPKPQQQQAKTEEQQEQPKKKSKLNLDFPGDYGDDSDDDSDT